MSEHSLVVESRFQELLRPAGAAADAAASPEDEGRRMQVGERYRIASRREVPALQFMLVLKNGNAVEVKYAYITERFFVRHDEQTGRNVLLIRIRDSIQVTIDGFNLSRLSEDLLMQRVVDVESVTLLQAKAALQADRDTPVIIGIRIEHGRMDLENGVWRPGSGRWSEEEQRWIAEAKAPMLVE